MRRFARRLARLVRPAPWHAVFDERYSVVVPGIPMDPDRGARILAFLFDSRLLPRRAVHQPLPTSMRNILRAHDPAYVQSLQDPAVVAGIVGAPLSLTEVGTVLDYQRLVAGGTIHATRLAVAAGRLVVHLAGGLHHAGPDRGAGFCIYNDVAVAVRRLQAKGFRRPVLIVDLDLHHGNGTRAIFADDRTVHTYSIHNAHWDVRPAVAATDIALGSGVQDDAYLEALERTLPAVIDEHRPGLVVYVAGTDPAADDVLGDWRISPAGLLRRDRFVIEQVRARRGARVPLVVVLGGGYGHGAWRHTARFLAWLAKGRALEPPDDMVVALRRMRSAFARLPGRPGRTSGALRITSEDLMGADGQSLHDGRLLGRFTAHGLEALLQGVGAAERLRALGYAQTMLDLDSGSGLGETLRIFGDPQRRHLLVEMRVRPDRRLAPGFELLFCEWMLLQNPRARFTVQAPALPGQQHPGLGLLGTMVAMLMLMAEQLGLDGVANVPSHYHVAAVGREHLRFADPAAQARFEALADLLHGLPLGDAEQALADGRVVDGQGVAVSWEPSLMAIPVSARFREALTGEAYESARAAARARLAYRIRD